MTAPTHRQACTGGSCRQGHEECQTPEACYVPIDPDRPGLPLDLLVLWAAVAAAFFAVLYLSTIR